jgi:serine/threonine-protein kinase
MRRRQDLNPHARTAALALRALLACALGLATALLIACGSSGKGLIPTANAGPLQSDFEAVSQAAQSGNGSCTATEVALAKTEQDFATLPASVDVGLRGTLHQGIANLRTRALALCTQPLAPTTTATSTTRTTTTQAQTTTTQSTPTQTVTTPTTPTQTTAPPASTGGGTIAPGEAPAGGNGNGNGNGNGPGNGGQGESNGGVGAGGQEAGK